MQSLVNLFEIILLGTENITLIREESCKLCGQFVLNLFYVLITNLDHFQSSLSNCYMLKLLEIYTFKTPSTDDPICLIITVM